MGLVPFNDNFQKVVTAMNWSVPVKNDGTGIQEGEWDKLVYGVDWQYWYIYCKRIRAGHMEGNYNVYLRHHEKGMMLLGETNMSSRLGTAWDAYGWTKWEAPEGRFYSVQGFATRRYAIGYMLSQHGFGDRW